MMTVSAETPLQRGGGWLLESVEPAGIFTPERQTNEHRLIARTAAEFVRNEVLPAQQALEQKDWSVARHLLRRCGELGLLGVDIPEAYGGVGLDKVSSLIISEHLSRAASFGATLG